MGVPWIALRKQRKINLDNYDEWSYNLIMDKKTLKKQEIIQKSIHVMFENGYNGTGVKDLTDAAGIPKGSLYNYFANKEDYAKEALFYYYQVMSKPQFDCLVDEKQLPLERIKCFYTTMIKDFNDPSNCKLGCFVGNLTQEMGGVSETLREVTNGIHSEIVQKIRACLVEADANGDMIAGKDLDVLAEFIVSSWQGSLLRIKASNNKKIVDDFYTVLTEVLLR